MHHTLRSSLLVLLSMVVAAPLALLPPSEPVPVALAAPMDQEACVRSTEPPPPVPGDPSTNSFWGRYRTPLPPTEVYNPPGPKRVGLQAGHWLTEQIPPELRGLGPGGSGGGKDEWEITLDIARRTGALLESFGVEVDILPTTIPVEYKAHVFLSIHSDGDPDGVRRGYKLGRAAWSATPEADDSLIATISDAYGATTRLPIDPVGPSRRMTAYYAFNSRRYCHAIAPGTPSAIIETGYHTSAADRSVLLGDPDAAARGIAQGLLRYLRLDP